MRSAHHVGRFGITCSCIAHFGSGLSTLVRRGSDVKLLISWRFLTVYDLTFGCFFGG